MSKMKYFIIAALSFLTILSSVNVQAFDDVEIVDDCPTDMVYMVDIELHKALIDLDVDLNEDKIITICEAQQFEGHLDLANKNIQITLGVNEFVNAKSIDLSNNPIIYLHLGQLPNLESLRLSNSNIKTLNFIPYGDFRSLTILDISNNDIDPLDFAVYFEELSKEEDDEYIYHLETLDISGLELDDMRFLSHVRHSLVHLFAENNYINDIDTITDIYGLTYLDLANNLITDLEGIGKLSILEILDLSGNQIDDITELTKLSRLHILHIPLNYLDTREDINSNGVFGEDRVVVQEILDDYSDRGEIIYVTYEIQKPMIILDFPVYIHTQGEDWEDPEGEVFVGKDSADWNDVVISGDEIEDDTLPGNYTIIYDYIDEEGNVARRVFREVIIEDPGISFTMNGQDTYTLNIGDEWTDPGFTATQNSTGMDITDEVFVHGFVSTAYAGEYELKYIITSQYGTEYEYTRTIIVLGDDVVDTPETPGETDTGIPTWLKVIASSIGVGTLATAGYVGFLFIRRKGGIA